MAWNGRKPASEMDPDERRQDYLAHRVRYLPRQLEAARHKVAALENEAARYGMVELLEVPQHG